MSNLNLYGEAGLSNINLYGEAGVSNLNLYGEAGSVKPQSIWWGRGYETSIYMVGQGV